MGKKTFEEIQDLKSNWRADPCWDLYETEGFEEHREELKKYQEKCEKEWEERIQEEELNLKLKAEGLGLVGLYKLILKQQEELYKLKEKL